MKSATPQDVHKRDESVIEPTKPWPGCRLSCSCDELCELVLQWYRVFDQGRSGWIRVTWVRVRSTYSAVAMTTPHCPFHSDEPIFAHRWETLIESWRRSPRFHEQLRDILGKTLSPGGALEPGDVEEYESIITQQRWTPALATHMKELKGEGGCCRECLKEGFIRAARWGYDD